MVAVVRKQAKIATKNKNLKVGHAGTLDPFATGLLVVGVGREATKRLDEFKNLPKTYVATVRLGATSDTQDSTGKIITNENLNHSAINRALVENLLSTFIGKQLQIPPMYSAKSIGGQRLYKLARQGIEVERQPSEIEIYALTLLDYSWPDLKIEIKCSAGTYIRSVAADIGAQLGVGAYCDQLRRTAIGPYTVAEAQKIATVKI